MIEFRKLTYISHLGSVILENSNLKIESGEKVFIGGKTGSGKTTVLKIINGLIPNLYKGKIYGYVRNLTPKKTYFISQHPEEQLFLEKAIDEAAFPLVCRGLSWLSAKEKVKKVMEEMEILYLIDKNSSHLSEGEKQLIHLASALASDVECIMLDEPFAHLFPSKVRKILEILFECDKTVIISEHKFYKKKYDRIFWIENRKIVEKSNIKNKSNFLDFKTNKINKKRNTLKTSDPFLNLDFDLLKGKFIAVVGPNGIGKTILLKKLAKKRKDATYCAQYPFYHFSKKTVKEEVDPFWLKELGLGKLKNRHPFSLSGGEARRIAIAKCLSSNLLLLDEPTAGQDFEFKVKLIKTAKKYGKTVLAATHDMELMRLCDEVVEVEN